MFTMLSRAKLEALVKADEGPWVTLSTPLHGGGPFTKEDTLRFRHLVDRARELRVEQQGPSRGRGDRLYGPYAGGGNRSGGKRLDSRRD